MKKNLSVGDRIDARCTKCRKTMNHILVAMVDQRPARVKCNTCGGEHNYKDPDAPKKTRAAATTKTKTTRVIKTKANIREMERLEWEKLRADMNSSRAVDYSMDGKFNVDALINHPVFGLGLVQEACGSRKIMVLFEEGKKLLRCA